MSRPKHATAVATTGLAEPDFNPGPPWTCRWRHSARAQAPIEPIQWTPSVAGTALATRPTWPETYPARSQFDSITRARRLETRVLLECHSGRGMMAGEFTNIIIIITTTPTTTAGGHRCRKQPPSSNCTSQP